ncbi:gliding motility-associated C-terminal domain-containing protein [Aquiflexum sp.]|uniref:T9SS type B sorting domain-containing protein n=1 Tax=Aquiflexum sp. TaxID=1872584 RepID=UPI0035932BF9
MKNYIKIFLGIFISLCISTELYSQDITLVGESKLTLKGEGVIFSAPSVKLKDNSQIIQAEAITLPQSGYIEMLSPDALLKTRILQMGKKAFLKVGIDSKADVSIVNQSSATAYSIGMDRLSEPESLPFFWKVTSLIPGDEEAMVDLQFSWTKVTEPLDFQLKSLVRKEGSDWLLEYGQEIQDTTVHLRNYTNLKAQSSVFTVSSVRLDSDGDGVPDIQEIREDTDPHDPTDYLDTDGDEVPDYIEVIQNTDPYNPISYLDSNGDGVPDYVRDRSPVMFINLSDIEIPWGYEGIDAMLPNSIVAVLGSGEIVNLEVTWDKSNLDIYKRGTYQIMGDFKSYPGLMNGYNLPSDILVTVLPKPAPIRVNLSQYDFVAEPDEDAIFIADISVVDPVDNIHEIILIDGDRDNGYFEIRNGNQLYWVSADPAAGKTEFFVNFLITDRDGNTLEFLEKLTRHRKSITELFVGNTITPGDDGYNDGWGVPDLMFYEGVRLQIFDRGGMRMFYTLDPSVKWDGTVNGRDVPVGTYYWTIEVGETGEIRKGLLYVLLK